MALQEQEWKKPAGTRMDEWMDGWKQIYRQEGEVSEEAEGGRSIASSVICETS